MKKQEEKKQIFMHDLLKYRKAILLRAKVDESVKVTVTQELLMIGGYRWAPEGNPFHQMIDLFKSYIPDLTKEDVDHAYEMAMKKYRDRAEGRPTLLMRKGRQYPMSLEKYNEFIDKVWKRSKKPKMHKKGILGVKWESPVCKPNLEDGKYLSYSIDINERGKYILKLSGETS